MAVLRDKLKLKPHVKPRGRPKNSAKIWASKSRKRQIDKISKTSEENKVKKSRFSDKLPASKKKPATIQGTASFRSQVRRKQRYQLKELNSNNTELIQIDNDHVEPNPMEEYDELGLLQADKNILVSYSGRKAWLNARLINAGQKLLRVRFPNVGGLQDVTKQDTLSFEKEEGEFVQILHCNENHWICVSNVGCKPGVVEVFDSMRTGSVSSDVKEAIASILLTSRPTIELVFPRVTQQAGSHDCGLFSLAYAYTACSGEEPSNLAYSQVKLRKHLKVCIDSGKIKPFSSKICQNPQTSSMRESFRIYCVCRLPDSGDKMVQCSSCCKWYHYVCVGIDSDDKVKGMWFCTNCDKR